MSSSQLHHDLHAVVGEFRIYGDLQSAAPYGNGHINDTYCVTFDQSGATVRYILQRLNHQVFPQPEVVMRNIERVTTHILAKLSESGREKPSRHCLSLLPCRGLEPWYQDPEGSYWRCYHFIEGATTYDQVQNSGQAFHAARAFGDFQKLLVDLPGDPLQEPIPRFHDTRHRFDAFVKAIARDVANRAAKVKAEMAFCLQREPMVDVLLKLERDGVLPRRIVHGDTKLNNVLLDDQTGEGICVIDLDTVMPGQVLHDFGDMCRTTTCVTPEDERNLALVEPSMEMLEALARGYLASFGSLLNPTERELLAFSASLVSFEIGIRFLEDYLSGDRYFKVKRPDHNLDRARAQFKLVQAFEQRQESMRVLVARTFRMLDSGVPLQPPTTPRLP